MAIKDIIAKIARQAAEARQNGKSSVKLNGRIFNLIEKGYCERFVRKCYEAGMDIPDMSWRYRAGDAWDGENAIKEGIAHGDKGLSKVSLNKSQPGDIIYFNSSGTRPGHVAIYLGNNQIAENTSSASRGNPRSAGTKITSLNEGNLKNRITGIYSMFAPSAASGFEEGSVKINVNNQTVEGMMTGGEDSHIIVGLRNLCNAINYDLSYDIVTRTATIKAKN